MKNELETVTKDFAGTPITFTRGQDAALWVDAEQVSVALGYGRRDEFLRLCKRHEEELTRWRATAKVTAPSAPDGRGGGEQTITIIEERGVYLLACLARTPRCAEFRRFVAEVCCQLRQGDLIERRQVDVRLADALEAVDQLHAELQDEHGRANALQRQLELAGRPPVQVPPVAEAIVSRARKGGSWRLTMNEVATIFETTTRSMAKHPLRQRFPGTRAPYHADDLRAFFRRLASPPAVIPSRATPPAGAAP